MMSPPSAQDLNLRLQELLARERASLVDFIVALAGFNRLKGFRDLGFVSLWQYLHRELGLSEAMAYYRKTAAELVERFPQVVELLRDGRLCITNLTKLAAVLTEENFDQVIGEASGQPKREVERIVARLAPKLMPRDVVRKQVDPSPQAPVPVTPAPTQVEILTEDRYRNHITIDREYRELLEQAQAALSHKLPHASELDILKEGLRRVIREHERSKGITAKPRAPRPSSARTLPRHVQRTVWTRDQGQCQWPIGGGKVCGSRHQVEFHHIVDRAKGGTHSVDNTVLLCRVHNQLAADVSWGEEFMNKIRGAGRAAKQDRLGANRLSAGLRWAAPQPQLPFLE